MFSSARMQSKCDNAMSSYMRLRYPSKHALTPQVLDVYAAVACVEYLEPQALDTDGQRLVWLRQVKRLQVPIELVCSEENLRHYKDRSMAMVHRVQ